MGDSRRPLREPRRLYHLLWKITRAQVCVTLPQFVIDPDIQQRFVLTVRGSDIRRTPVGFLHRLIWIHTPNVLLSIDNKLTSGRTSSSLYRVGRFLMHDRHPTIVVRFIAR